MATLRDFIKELQDFAEANPETLDMEVVTCNGNPCNGYRAFYPEPVKGVFDPDCQRFWEETDYEEEGFKESDTNAVTIDW
jgi:hypothetical protein